MVTQKQFYYLINRIPVATLSLMILFNVAHFQSLASSLNSSFNLHQNSKSVTKISTAGEHHNKDSQDEKLPFNENKPEEDNDEETKENSKENNHLSDYYQGSVFCLGFCIFTKISNVYYLQLSNRRTLVPFYILFHSWKDYLI